MNKSSLQGAYFIPKMKKLGSEEIFLTVCCFFFVCFFLIYLWDFSCLSCCFGKKWSYQCLRISKRFWTQLSQQEEWTLRGFVWAGTSVERQDVVWNGESNGGNESVYFILKRQKVDCILCSVVCTLSALFGLRHQFTNPKCRYWGAVNHRNIWQIVSHLII